MTFYSRDGHTRKAAEIIASALKANGLGAHLGEILDKKKRKGILGFLRAGYDATHGKMTQISFTRNPLDYHLVVIGTPVWNGRVTPAVRTYLLQNRRNIKRAALFTTCAWRAGRCLRQMRKLYPGEILAEKVIFSKKIEKEAKSFAEELVRLLNHD